MHPNADPLPGISVGPGLLLVELGDLHVRFAAAGWTKAQTLSMLQRMRVRPIPGAHGTLWYLKEAVDLGLVALSHPSCPRRGLTGAFMRAHGAELVRMLVLYRTMSHENKTVDRTSLSQALQHVADSITRYGEKGGKELVRDSGSVWLKRRDMKDPSIAPEASPPRCDITPRYDGVNGRPNFPYTLTPSQPRQAQGSGSPSVPHAPPVVQ